MFDLFTRLCRAFVDFVEVELLCRADCRASARG